MKVFFVRHGQTLNNVERRPYANINEPLTENGIQQSILAGKYLKTFNYKFDLVISSPATQCIQTAENIIKEIGYNKKIKIDNLILEQIYKNTAGLSSDEYKKFIEKAYTDNSELIKKINEIKKITDPFKRLELLQNNLKNIDKIMNLSSGEEPFSKQMSKHKKFLNELKKLDKKCILVVGHGGTINYIQRIITNTCFDADTPTISIIPKNIKSSILYFWLK
jgi:broad specificity phosphatase PhoE